jgi:pimeloyl-ACP methyl ester carboxylesterase
MRRWAKAGVVGASAYAIFTILSAWQSYTVPGVRTAFDDAQKEGIVVVDGRRAVDNSANQSRRQPRWVANAVPGYPGSSLSQHLGLKADLLIVVIFVHGYNVTASEGLVAGNAVLKHLRKSNEKLRQLWPTLPESRSIAFVNFLWRGDFGLLRFSEAQTSAENTALAFSEVLTEVTREAPSARIVILTHSLGSEVALEALRLRKLAAQSGVDALFLVQPAVPAYSIYRWTVKFQQMPEPGQQLPREQVDQCNGRYVSAAQLATQLVYTFSAKDKVLVGNFNLAPFRVDEFLDPLPLNCELPPDPFIGVSMATIPLGGPFSATDRRQVLPPPLPIRNGPKQSNPPPVQPFVPGSMVFDFKDFAVDHPHPRELDIGKYRDLHGGMVSGHSVLFEDAGEPIVEDLWRLYASSLSDLISPKGLPLR